MSERVSLSELHEIGRERAQAAATSVVGLRHEETLVWIAEFRERLAARKAAMALSGFSQDEVQAWEGGYTAGLFERLAGCLAASEAIAAPPRRANKPG